MSSVMRFDEWQDSLGNPVASALVGTGKILQVVSAVKTDTFATTSSSYTDVTGLSATITPTSASSKIFVLAQIAHAGFSNSTGGTFKITGGNTASYVGAAAGSRTVGVFGGGGGATVADMVFSGTLAFLDSPATTSSTTYQVQVISPISETAAVNRTFSDTDGAGHTRGASTITLWEVAG